MNIQEVEKREQLTLTISLLDDYLEYLTCNEHDEKYLQTLVDVAYVLSKKCVELDYELIGD